MLVNELKLSTNMLLRFVSPHACKVVAADISEVRSEYDLSLIDPLCVRIGGARWLTPTNLPPRGMRVVLASR